MSFSFCRSIHASQEGLPEDRLSRLSAKDRSFRLQAVESERNEAHAPQTVQRVLIQLWLYSLQTGKALAPWIQHEIGVSPNPSSSSLRARLSLLNFP